MAKCANESDVWKYMEKSDEKATCALCNYGSCLLLVDAQAYSPPPTVIRLLYWSMCHVVCAIAELLVLRACII